MVFLSLGVEKNASVQYQCCFKVVPWKARVIQRFMSCVKSVFLGLWASTFFSLNVFLYFSVHLNSVPYTGIFPTEYRLYFLQ